MKRLRAYIFRALFFSFVFFLYHSHIVGQKTSNYFIGIELPAKVFRPTQSVLKKKFKAANSAAYRPHDSYHITLVSLGRHFNGDEHRISKAIAQGVRNFKNSRIGAQKDKRGLLLTIPKTERLALFGKNKNFVVYRVHPAKTLQDLKNEIQVSLKAHEISFTKKKRMFVPHVSVGKVFSSTTNQDFLCDTIPPGPFMITKVHFFRSSSGKSQYKSVACFRLKGAAS